MFGHQRSLVVVYYWMPVFGTGDWHWNLDQLATLELNRRPMEALSLPMFPSQGALPNNRNGTGSAGDVGIPPTTTHPLCPPVSSLPGSVGAFKVVAESSEDGPAPSDSWRVDPNCDLSSFYLRDSHCCVKNEYQPQKR